MEHLLLAAVASCFVVTFHALAGRARMDLEKLELSVESKLGTPRRKTSVGILTVLPSETRRAQFPSGGFL